MVGISASRWPPCIYTMLFGQYKFARNKVYTFCKHSHKASLLKHPTNETIDSNHRTSAFMMIKVRVTHKCTSYRTEQPSKDVIITSLLPHNLGLKDRPINISNCVGESRVEFTATAAVCNNMFSRGGRHVTSTGTSTGLSKTMRWAQSYIGTMWIKD